MKVTFENLNIRSQLSRLPRLAHLRLSVEIMCASGGFIGSIVNNKATLMDQSILDGLPEGYTLAKVGNSTKWIQKILSLITHKLEVPCLELPLQVRAVAKV